MKGRGTREVMRAVKEGRGMRVVMRGAVKKVRGMREVMRKAVK